MTTTPESTSSLTSPSPTVATIIYSNTAKFPLGQIVATPGALELLQETGFSAVRLPLNFGALSPGFMRRSCAEPPASVARIAWG